MVRDIWFAWSLTANLVAFGAIGIMAYTRPPACPASPTWAMVERCHQVGDEANKLTRRCIALLEQLHPEVNDADK